MQQKKAEQKNYICNRMGSLCSRVGGADERLLVLQVDLDGNGLQDLQLCNTLHFY